MFLSEWHEFPLAPCLAEKKKLDSSRLSVVEIARVPKNASKLVSFLVRLRTYQHSSIYVCVCVCRHMCNTKYVCALFQIARLYLISDILHNCGVKITNASYYRKG